ncbi:YbdD/YjiX family protein [Kocuria sp.]|uniref:YbdD/YjiX family protein n=1 Tax=Kocuria sp. TaxID=1871328 RepID=UPI0026E0ECDA|nr:YbdD/YjiX family protein [Kocuria sp.]MDO5618008.1 YbdD/YjiX family protein [Kocuria sp.]
MSAVGDYWKKVRATGGNVAGWFSGVLGADKYQRYLEFHAAHGEPGAAPMTEREFWRDWQDHQQNNPQGRCC